MVYANTYAHHALRQQSYFQCSFQMVINAALCRVVHCKGSYALMVSEVTWTIATANCGMME
jgi:hypothetical protein